MIRSHQLMTKTNRRPPLSFAQYQRLHNVIHSLNRFFNKDDGRSCVFFSITGAALMHEHYNLNAKVICGGGAVLLDPKSKTVLSWFTQNPDGSLTTGHDAFHAWVECDGWLIDFTAPNYREATISATRSIANPKPADTLPPVFVPPRMMLQKRIDQTEGSLDDMSKPGDCVFVPHPDVTASVIDSAFERPSLGDVIYIASTWHRPVPKKMGQEMTITDDLGKISTIKLVNRSLSGVW